MFFFSFHQQASVLEKDKTKYMINVSRGLSFSLSRRQAGAVESIQVIEMIFESKWLYCMMVRQKITGLSNLTAVTYMDSFAVMKNDPSSSSIYRTTSGLSYPPAL